MIKYPYTDFHEMNLDWLLQQMKELNERMDNFVTEITADIIPIVQQAIEEGLIDVTYDSTNETVVLVPGAGVTSQHLAKFFQINNYKYPVADQTARDTINNWISNFNYTSGNMYKKAIFIGDSFLAGWSPDGEYTSWGVILAGKLGLTVDTSAFIYYQGGAGFVATNQDRNFITMLTEAINDNRFSNDDIDLIVVGGGQNDQWTTTSVTMAAMSNFSTAAKANFPNARIYVANMCFSQYKAASRSTVYDKLRLSNAYYRGAVNSGMMPFSDCWKALWGRDDQGNTYMASDDFHPNQAGQQELAGAIYSFITSGSYSMPEKRIIGISETGTVWIVCDGDSVRVGMSGNYTLDASHFNITSGNISGNDVRIQFDVIDGFSPVSNMTHWGIGMVMIETEDYHYYPCQTLLGIRDGRITLYPLDVNDNHTNFRNLTNMRKCVIYSMAMSVPMIWA